MSQRSPKPRAAGPKPIYYLYGDDDFLRSEALRNVLRDVLGPQPDPISIVEFDGSKAQLADVLDELRMPSMLSPWRVVVLRGADAFILSRKPTNESTAGDDVDDSADVNASDAREADRVEAASRNRKALERYLESPSSTGVLVLVLRSKATTRLFTLAEKVGQCIDCSGPRTSSAMQIWAKRHAKEAFGCSLAADSAQRLVELVGNDCGRMDSELGKLSTYAAPRKSLERGDVEELVGARREEKVFGLWEAIAAKDSVGALRLWHQVLATDRAAPFRALGGLAWSLRRFAAAARLLEAGVPPPIAARKVGFFGDGSLQLRVTRRFTVQRWEDLVVHLRNVDVGVKSGATTTALGVEKLIVGACAAASNRG